MGKTLKGGGLGVCADGYVWFVSTMVGLSHQRKLTV